MTLKPEMSNELRAMVRDILREVVPPKTAPSLSAVEAVRISNDADLQAFINRLSDPAIQERVKDGKLRFTLGGTAGSSPGAALTGVITERTIDKHAGTGALILAADAILTPLARDKARKLGLKIERRR